MWPTPASTASRMNATFLEVFLSRLVPRPILATSTSPSRNVLVIVAPPRGKCRRADRRPHRCGGRACPAQLPMTRSLKALRVELLRGGETVAPHRLRHAHAVELLRQQGLITRLAPCMGVVVDG